MNNLQENIAERIIERIRKDGWVYMKALRLEFEEGGVNNNDWTIACNALYELNIIKEMRANSGDVSLTETVGRKFTTFNEYYTHLDDKDRYDFLTKKYVYKWRWLPYLISLIALIVAICSYFKKGKENTSGKQVAQRMIKQVPKNGTLYKVRNS